MRKTDELSRWHDFKRDGDFKGRRIHACVRYIETSSAPCSCPYARITKVRGREKASRYHEGAGVSLELNTIEIFFPTLHENPIDSHRHTAVESPGRVVARTEEKLAFLH
jgi:hypothetical protein